MSVEIWPSVTPLQLKVAVETSQSRELDWLIEELHETLTNLKHGLEDCYALLAPIDPGSTLVVSTSRNEIVKGTLTRVGTRIVKGTINIRMRTLPHQTLTINPDHPIHLAPLTSLHTLLTHSIDLLGLTFSYSYPTSHSPPPGTKPLPPTDTPSAEFLAAQLRALSQSLAEASSLLKGPPLTSSDPSWTTRSVASSHFLPSPTHPPLPLHNGVPPLSFHLSIQDSCLVLWLRSLEPADAPVNFGKKLALAIGTTRRLEHDEAEKMFGFCCADDTVHAHPHNSIPRAQSHGGAMTGLAAGGRHASFPVATSSSEIPLSGKRDKEKEVDVYVREKVRVGAADPSLLSLSSKLTALGHTLGVARRNLAAVMGEELED
ncbi:RAVE subunit 2/Rogdi [Podospora aff. communis PSN243]|uniref:RAVE subunit 2/Rogdi n=1 Tax=Podospora aff. communis PSN243 TaxID=3040156 RepID=A0AAV9GUW8_9PEZI|nr:RAVE subunit 2/Rogdi [Podospora aff. communis PSN243]